MGFGISVRVRVAGKGLDSATVRPSKHPFAQGDDSRAIVGLNNKRTPNAKKAHLFKERKKRKVYNVTKLRGNI